MHQNAGQPYGKRRQRACNASPLVRMITGKVNDVASKEICPVYWKNVKSGTFSRNYVAYFDSFSVFRLGWKFEELSNPSSGTSFRLTFYSSRPPTLLFSQGPRGPPGPRQSNITVPMRAENSAGNSWKLDLPFLILGVGFHFHSIKLLFFSLFFRHSQKLFINWLFTLQSISHYA